MRQNYTLGYTRTGCANKNNPLEKNSTSQQLQQILNESCRFYSEEHMQQIQLRYLVRFKNYNKLKLKGHFSK